MTKGVTVAVTDHPAERFRQRVGSRVGGFDVKPEITGRVSEAWSAGRTSDVPPSNAAKPPRADRSMSATSWTAAGSSSAATTAPDASCS